MIKKYIAEFHAEQADIVRKLIKEGSIFIAIQGYATRQYSTEKATSLSVLPLAEFIDLLVNLGICSRLEFRIAAYFIAKEFSEFAIIEKNRAYW
jgi:hypothetical protein